LGAALHPVRDKVYISSKVPLFLISKPDEFDDFLQRSLEQLQVEYLDFHHFHALTYTSWKEKILGLKLLDQAEKAKAKGLIKHLSFSFHGDADKMSELIDTGAFSSILGQYNVVDRRNEEVFAYAKSKGLGTAVMGPLMGGNLIAGGKPFVEKMQSEASSAAEMGLRFAWSLPAVDVVFSGMTTMAHLEENVRCAESANAIPMEERQALIDRSHAISKLNDLYCTGCMYCAVCPEKIQPARLFQLYIYHHVWGFSDSVRRRLSRGGMVGPGPEPTVCTGCGACSARCPQKIDIPAELKRIWPVLAELKG
jgi:predicted aldo/keto reductase-like oxidoreductase